MNFKTKKVSLAILLGLNMLGLGVLSQKNTQKLSTDLVNDSQNAKLAARLGGGSFWQGAGGAVGGLIGAWAGGSLAGPWGGYVGAVLGAGAGAY